MLKYNELKKKGKNLVKNLIKKTAATTLSMMGILSAMPSVFCTSGEEPQNTNIRGHIDWFNIMVVGKYLNSVEDLCNLSIVNKKYKDILLKYCYNPVGINSIEQLASFPNIETCLVGKCEGDFISTFPNDDIKTLIYLPGSFNLLQITEILTDNEVINDEGKCINNWERIFELNGENPKDGCRITFTNGEKTIVFMYSLYVDKVLIGPSNYNAFLKNCRLDKKELAAAFIKVPNVVSIPSSVTSIGRYAFGYQESLTKVNIPSSVTTIEEDAFCHCTGLREVNIPDSVTSIGYGAFELCSLTNISIPNSVTSIDDWAFYGCGGLTNINVPTSVTKIGNNAFRYCKSLREISIPTSVTSLGDNVLDDCENLNHIEFNGKTYTSVDGFMQAFNEYRVSQEQ